jgi:Na+/H+ antiporter NhaB
VNLPHGSSAVWMNVWVCRMYVCMYVYGSAVWMGLPYGLICRVDLPHEYAAWVFCCMGECMGLLYVCMYGSAAWMGLPYGWVCRMDGSAAWVCRLDGCLGLLYRSAVCMDLKHGLLASLSHQVSEGCAAENGPVQSLADEGVYVGLGI